MGQFFHKKSGSQEDNQASFLGCPHLFFCFAEEARTLEFCFPAEYLSLLFPYRDGHYSDVKRRKKGAILKFEAANLEIFSSAGVYR